MQQRFVAIFPIRHAHFAGEHSGLDADKRNRLGQRKRRADLFARFARLERRGTADIFLALLRRAAFVNRREAKIARQTAGGRAGIHPREFKREQRERQIFRPGDESALLRVQRRGGDAAFIVVLEQAVFFRRPFVRVAPARRHEPRDRSARHAARGLHEHVEFVTVGKTPHDLADVVGRQRGEAAGRNAFNEICHKIKQACCLRDCVWQLVIFNKIISANPIRINSI